MHKRRNLTTFVLRSSYRKEIFQALSNQPGITQKDLLKTTAAKYRSHVSRTIKELLENDLISCKNPEDSTYKIYDLTTNGQKVKEEITELYSREP